MAKFVLALLSSLLSLSLVSGSTMLRNSDLAASTLIDPLVRDMKTKFAQNDFLRYVASGSKVKQAKAFLPYMTFFGNSFSDINTMILPYKNAPRSDKLKQAINHHCEEDSTHLYMLWDDLVHCQDRMEELGVTTFQESVKFLWGTRMHRTRELGYEMARLAALADKPLQRYCMIRVMEELGQVFLKTVAGRVELYDGKPSTFLGQHHLDMEDGCLQSESVHGCELDKLFEDLDFDSQDDRDIAEYAMKCTYNAFNNMLQCMYDNMNQDRHKTWLT